MSYDWVEPFEIGDKDVCHNYPPRGRNQKTIASNTILTTIRRNGSLPMSLYANHKSKPSLEVVDNSSIIQII